MEVRIHISTRIVAWLASMGYPVAGMPGQILHRMLLHEARQWQISPEALAGMIDEGEGQYVRAAPQNVRPIARHAHQVRRPADRQVGSHFSHP